MSKSILSPLIFSTIDALINSYCFDNAISLISSSKSLTLRREYVSPFNLENFFIIFLNNFES